MQLRVAQKLWLSVASLAMAVAALPVHAQAAKTVRFAVEGAFAPFEFIDKQGKPQGFNVDLANALCAQMKTECEFIVQEWDGLIPGLRAKRYDAIIATMSITDERKRVISFTNPYMTNVLALVASRKSDISMAEEKIKGKVVGAQRATIAGQYLEDKMGKLVTVRLYDTQENAYLDLASGRLDALLTDKYPAYDWLQTKAGKAFEFKGTDLDVDDKIGIGLRKEDNALRERLNAALAVLVKDGAYEKINAKYFPFSIY